MKKQKSQWYQPEGWLSFGAIVVIALLVVYLIFMVVRQFLPRLRKIDRMYNEEAAIHRGYDGSRPRGRFVLASADPVPPDGDIDLVRRIGPAGVLLL